MVRVRSPVSRHLSLGHQAVPKIQFREICVPLLRVLEETEWMDGWMKLRLLSFALVGLSSGESHATVGWVIYAA